MVVVCPACSKADQASSVCNRCGCDLSQMQATLAAAASCLAKAMTTLRARHWTAALALSGRSWHLWHSPEAARLAFLAAAALGQTASALRWRERARSP